MTAPRGPAHREARFIVAEMFRHHSCVSPNLGWDDSSADSPGCSGKFRKAGDGSRGSRVRQVSRARSSEEADAPAYGVSRSLESSPSSREALRVPKVAAPAGSPSREASDDKHVVP